MVDKSLSSEPQRGTTKKREKKKSCKSFDLQDSVAEREGFEPPEPLSSTVFKTAAIDHSAISPVDSFLKCFAKVRINSEYTSVLRKNWIIFFGMDSGGRNGTGFDMKQYIDN